MDARNQKPAVPTHTQELEDELGTSTVNSGDKGFLNTLIVIGRNPLLSFLEVCLKRSDELPRRSLRACVASFRKKYRSAFVAIVFFDLLIWLFVIFIVMSVALRGLNIHPITASIDSIDYFIEKMNQDNYPDSNK